MRLSRQLTKGKISARDKAKAIHDWVAGSVSYDVQKSVNLDFRADDSALKTLRTREGVCQDFSFLTIALARAAGLEARFIGGKTVEKGRINPNGHGWTEVKADGRWLVMDTTWDAGYIEGDRFVRDFSEKYFDPDPAEFARDHIREEIIY
nr:transglutaminase-like domain-containing protein [Phosphitispora fastidiosa]